ncbi:heme peroxidase [Xylariomycetidae sp. FL2044]|nr:heme peroxidase [Xylariomycetidae sp. FL2044]
MRWYTASLSAMLCFTMPAGGDPTWPSPMDELEEIMYQVTGFRSREFGAPVIPCNDQLFGPGRRNSAEWLRAAFHDMATTTNYDNVRAGGLDGSLQYELTSADHIGPDFNDTLTFMADYYTSRSGVADLLALGVYYAVRSCGGPAVPFSGGRVDATEAGPIGVPLPQNSAFTFEQQYLRMGFNRQQMIQSVACGHTLGSVREADFPQIVPPGSTPDGELAMDSTVAVFDNKVVTEYLDGTTQDPLVVGPSVKSQRNSDFKVFNYDRNATIKGMSDPTAFGNVCATVFQQMINTVPAGVVLSDPIQPYSVKPVSLQLAINPGASSMNLTGFIRVRTTNANRDPVSSITLTYKDRRGTSNCGVSGCARTLPLSGVSQGFDDDFVWFPINFNIDTSTGISSFTLALNTASGLSTSYDNNGQSYPVQDAIMLQTPQSCLTGGSLTVTAAVRNDRNSLPVNVVVYYKNPTGDPNRPVPDLNNATVAMNQGDCVGPYTLYTANFTGLGDLDYETRFDLVSGNDNTASVDDFKAASGLGGTCYGFSGPPVSRCTTPGKPSNSSSSVASSSTQSASVNSTSSTIFIPSSSATSSTRNSTASRSASPITSTSPVSASTTSSKTSTSSTLAIVPTVSPYVRVGCYLEIPNGRALTGASYANDSMTLELCAARCSAFTYWAAEYGRECYCGNTLDSRSSQRPDTDCNMVCAGNRYEYCGAGNRLELYQRWSTTPSSSTSVSTTSWSSAVSTRSSSVPTGSTIPSSKSSSSGFIISSTMTSNRPAPSITSSSASTSSSRASDSPSASGTTSSASSTTSSSLAHRATVTPYTFMGCWTEGNGVRALGAKSTTSSNNMTLENCASFCSAYHYFGTEYARECYCANVPDASSNQTALGNCSMQCSGNPYQYCGGPARLELYYTNSSNGPSQPVLVTNAAGTNYTWAGCRTETGDPNNRALASSRRYTSANNMTLESCAQYCDGFRYFGTEYADECYCADDIAAGSSPVGAAACGMVCSGNAKQFCGAGNRLSVYEKSGGVS